MIWHKTEYYRIIRLHVEPTQINGFYEWACARYCLAVYRGYSVRNKQHAAKIKRVQGRCKGRCKARHQPTLTTLCVVGYNNERKI